MRIAVAGLALTLLAGNSAFAQETGAGGETGDAALEACAPKTLEEAETCLGTVWSEPARQEFLARPYETLIDYHHGLGRWMRNYWGLWSGGPLAKDMERLGLRHPDDMSMEIIRSYWLKAHGCSDAPAQQAAYRKLYFQESLKTATRAPNGLLIPGKVDIPPPHLDCTTSADGSAR